MSHESVLSHDNLLTEIIDSFDDIVWSLALPDLTPLYFNAAATRAYQCTVAELIANQWRWLELIAIEDQSEVKQAIAQAQISGQSKVRYRIQRCHDRDNGQEHSREIWFEARLKVFKDGAIPIRLDAIATEMQQPMGRNISDLQSTDPQSSELEIQRLNAELEKRIQQHNAELRDSKSRHLAILQALPDLLLLLKPDGTCLQCIMPSNQERIKYLPIQHHISEVLPPENLQIHLKIYEKAIATGEVQIYEHQLTKFGKTVYEEVRIAPYFEDELLVIVRDITDRKLAEELLRKSDAHLKTAQRISKLGSWEFEVNTGKLTWSDEVFRIYGLEPKAEPPVYEELKNYIHPDDWEHFNKTVQMAINLGQSYDLEHRIIQPSGSLVYVVARGEMVYNFSGQLTHIIGTALDITNRKLTEAALSHSHDLREAIFNESTDALFLVDSQTLLTTDCNRLAVELFEATNKSELIGIEGHILQRYQFSQEELESINLEIAQQGFWSLEVEYVTRKGRYFWGNLAVKPIVAAGQTINLVRVTNISDRKQAEAKIIETSQQLAITNRELESFCYSVSHDLRAPLRHINGFVNALQQQLALHASLHDPKIDHYLQIIHKSSQKMGSLIDGLLVLSRYGRRPLELKPVSIRELIDEAIEVLSSDPNLNPRLEFVIGELPNTSGDPTLLQQLFRNLIGNAVKFSRNQPQPRIEIDSLDQTIRIRDNGVGFQMEYADKLFGAFQRLHNEQDFEGTGIGLAIAQRIIQRHGGSIWAESSPNQGATFFVKL